MLAKWRLSLVGLVSIGYVSSANAGQTELLVPAYFYPSGSGLNDWARMSAVAPQVDLTAILNPNSGPGASVDPNYVAVDDSLRSAGGHVLGYVYSSYGARSLAAVEADIDSYLGMYGVDGFFIDEMASSPADHAYYKTLYNYIHAKSPNLRVVTNPGTSFDQSYLADPVADTVVSFEGSGSQYAGYSPDPWMSAYPARDFGHVVHTEAGVAAML
ncbi:MAG TPA: spherulation-specific family 4 protein, partial [Fimbriimonadaceae bacterium]|nr:spherulation-specific family 4 protein [Fimbriimonadaceae bacterium]